MQGLQTPVLALRRAAGLLWPCSLVGAVWASRPLLRPCAWSGEPCILPPSPADLDLLRWALAILLSFHAVLIPGWLLASRLRIPAPVRWAAGVPLSVLLWALVHAVLLVVGLAGQPRAYAVAGALVQLACLAAGACAAPRATEVAAAMVGVAALGFLGPGRIAWHSMDGDGVEAMSFARSLRHRMLPRWDLENGAWGFYPSFMSFAYPLHTCQVLMGTSEASNRVALIPLTSAMAAVVGAPHAGLARAVAMGTCLVVSLTSAFNYTYEPYPGDVAEPTVTDLCFAVHLLVAAWAWVTARMGLWAAASLLAITGQPAGLPYLCVVIAAALLAKGTRRLGLTAAWILVVLVLVRTSLDRIWNPPIPTKFSASAFLAHHTAFIRPGGRQALTQAWALLVQTGFVPLLSLRHLARRVRPPTPWAPLALALAVYATAVVWSPRRHPHYLTPVAAMSLFLVPPGGLRRSQALLTAACLAGIIPPSCPPDTRPARFGGATLMVFPSPEAAVEHASLLYRVLQVPPWRNEREWGLGKHTWVAYARHAQELPATPPPGVHVVLTQVAVPWSGFHLVTADRGASLFESPPGWMGEWRAQGGPVHCWGPLLKVSVAWDPLSRWGRRGGPPVREQGVAVCPVSGCGRRAARPVSHG